MTKGLLWTRSQSFVSKRPEDRMRQTGSTSHGASWGAAQ